MGSVASTDFAHPDGRVCQLVEDGQERYAFVFRYFRKQIRESAGSHIVSFVRIGRRPNHEDGIALFCGAKHLACICNTLHFRDASMSLFKGSVVHAKGENYKRGAIAREPCLYFRPPPLDYINTSLSPDPKVVIREIVALLSSG